MVGWCFFLFPFFKLFLVLWILFHFSYCFECKEVE
nr:MAG TPA: TRX family protein [Caudoviricetes sp.]